MGCLRGILLSLPHKLKIIFIFIGLTFNANVVMAVETVFWIDNQTGIAMGGYDPISFFLRGRGGHGSKNYEYFWQGAIWRFENEGNLTAFRDSPLTYAPQFGGFDALKLSQNIKVTPDPQFGDVYENRLYLFHSQENFDEWLPKKAKVVKAAQNNWIKLYSFDLNKNFAVNPIVKEDILNFGQQ